MSFAMRLPIKRLFSSLQTCVVENQKLHNIQARTFVPHLRRSEHLTCLHRYMCSAGSSGNHLDDLIQEIESFGRKNFRYKYDQELLREVCSKFFAVGVEKEDLIHAFCRPSQSGNFSDPPVFTMNMSLLENLLKTFVNHDIKPKAIIRVVHYYGNDITKLTPNQLEAVLVELATLPYMETPITRFLDVCPQLIILNDEMEEKLKTLRSIFPKKELLHLLRNAPNVLIDPWKVTEEKLVYIYEEMGLDQPHISYNKTLSYSIEHIKDRHEAMVRTGTYKKPKLSRDRLSHLMNEKMEYIMESSDAQFCQRILKIPQEDYECFLELLHRERGEDYSGLQSDDFEAEEEVLEQQALRNSYGLQSKRSLSKMPKKDYQRWLQNM